MDHNNIIPVGTKEETKGVPQISIIVPIYKVEKFLRESLDSIKAQTFTDWECILVDDGSPDDSGKICDEYAAEDKRFKVVHQKNGGVSAARNTGVTSSRGRFIGFVDPDDIAHSRMFERLYDLINQYNADVAIVSYEILFTSGKKERRLVENISVLDRPVAVRELIRDIVVQSYLWNKLFRREVIDAPFPPGQVFEDIQAHTLWSKNFRKVVISPEILYSYRKREGSIVNSSAYTSNRVDYVNAIIHRVTYLHELEPDEVTEKVVEKVSWKGLVSGAKTLARYMTDPEARMAGVERLSEFGKSLPTPHLATLGPKMWWRAMLLVNFPALFIRNMRLVYLFNSHKRHRNEKMFN